MNQEKEDLAGCYTCFLFLSLFVLSGYLSNHFDSELPIQIFFSILAIFCLFQVFPKIKSFILKSIKKENKKYLYIALGIIVIFSIYQIFFRYEYKIYEDKYSRGYVVKLDRLTGKVTQKYAEEEKKKIKRKKLTKLECEELYKDSQNGSLFADISLDVYNENCK